MSYLCNVTILELIITLSLDDWLKDKVPAAVDTTEVGAVKPMLWGAREKIF